MRRTCLSVSELSAVPGDHILAVFKAYFDGGNQADSTRYRTLTLAAFCARPVQWDGFTEEWEHVLKSHGAKWLHTTDAVATKKSFLEWKRPEVDALIGDCVSVIERRATVRLGGHFDYFGIRPIAATVFLQDFKRALKVYPIHSPEMHCALHCATAAQVWGKVNGYDKIEFFFDRNEPFAGHIKDRLSSTGAHRVRKELRDYIVNVGEADSKVVPALQAADLLAWCINTMYDGGIKRDWQRRMLKIDRDSQVFRYSMLSHPNKEHVDIIASWKLPRRKPMK
jgi:hypothetical protein